MKKKDLFSIFSFFAGGLAISYALDLTTVKEMILFIGVGLIAYGAVIMFKD
jgi:hypothetical protein